MDRIAGLLGRARQPWADQPAWFRACNGSMRKHLMPQTLQAPLPIPPRRPPDAPG